VKYPPGPAGERRGGIERLNEEIRQCRNCGLHRTRSTTVCGEGSPGARLMLVAQAPGATEDIRGEMFIGPSGKVLDELLGEAGVSRTEIYMTNLIKCMLPKNRKPKQDEIESCSGYLEEEIKIVNPSVLVPLGYYAAKYVFNKFDIPLPQKPEFNSVYSRIFLLDSKKVFPLQHPAAVLYNNSIMDEMEKSYRKLKVLSSECKWYHVCPIKRFYEIGVLNKKWVELYCKGDWESCVRYRMEEKGEMHPDYMLPDGSIDKKLC